MKYLITKSKTYTVEETGSIEKPLIIRIGGEEYKDAGRMIRSLGGVEKFLTLCVDEDGFAQYKARMDYRKSPEYQALQEARKEAAKATRERILASKEEAYNRLIASCGGVIETTAENISIVLGYLNTVNWGGWELPKMSIGYSCNQYDCDGRTATTMRLDEPIEYEGEFADKFVTGAPAGHLMKYRRI